MTRWTAVVGLFAVLGVYAACSPPAPPPAVCEEGASGCTGASQPERSTEPSARSGPVGLPQAALPEDQETPPPGVSKPVGATPPSPDAGTDPADAAVEAGAGVDVPPVDPDPPVGDCWSGTLAEFLEPSGCYQRKSDGMWFQCKDTLWYRGVADGVGPFGPCTSTHPLAP